MSTPTLATVSPSPPLKLSMILLSDIPATAPSVPDPSIRARNGWTLNWVINTTMTATPAMAARISRVS